MRLDSVDGAYIKEEEEESEEDVNTLEWELSSEESDEGLSSSMSSIKERPVSSTGTSMGAQQRPVDRWRVLYE